MTRFGQLISYSTLLLSILVFPTMASAGAAEDVITWQGKVTAAEAALKAAKTGAETSSATIELESATTGLKTAKDLYGKELDAKKAALDLPSPEPIGKRCYQDRPLVGDLAYLGGWAQNWSVGTTAAAQIARYTFGTKRAAINTGLGVGISFRYYGDTPIGDTSTVKRDQWPVSVQELGQDETMQQVKLPIYRIAPNCRATTTDVGQNKKLASSILSISPVIYASQLDTVGELSLQPAIQLGVLNDLINIGTGFNLTGQDKGKVFLLFSLGYGFKF